MKYRKLQNIKCDENGIPLLIQETIIRGHLGVMFIEITFYNGIKTEITVETFNDISDTTIKGKMLGQSLTDDMILDVEQICRDFEIVERACEEYKWLQSHEDGNYIDSFNTIDIDVLRKKEHNRLKDEQLKNEIDQLMESFLPGQEYDIDIDQKQRYIIKIPKAKSIIAKAKDLEELQSSLIDYINIKSLSPVEYLTKLLGETLVEKYQGNNTWTQ